jgi:hypothetical protein
MIGYSDFVSGRIPKDIELGWSSVVNPEAKIAYICFFKGSKDLAEDEIALGFNDLWLQFGGRNFVPWASYKGAPDATFCLATENATGAYATGLHNAKKTRRVLGSPTTLQIKPHSSKVLYYATALVKYEGNTLDEGIESIESHQSKIIVNGIKSGITFSADADFSILKKIEMT